jgi:hypothetical protein
MMRKRTKATVRRRLPEDDDWCPPEDRWPPEFKWICDVDTYYEDGSFAGGCVSPFITHAEALADAIESADETRRWNEREEQENARSDGGGVRDQAAVAEDLEAD